MKVALITPRLFNQAYHFFPTGLGYIAGALKLDGIEFGWYDFNVEHWTTSQLVDRIKNDAPCDCFGITGLISSFVHVKEICRQLRLAFPETPIILGGKQSNIPAEILFAEAQPDYVIHGEGEEVFPKLLKLLANNRPPTPGNLTCCPNASSLRALSGTALKEMNSSAAGEGQTVAGLIYRDEHGAIHQNSMARLEHKGSTFRIPFRELPMDKYISRLGAKSAGLRSVNLISGRGCPFECTFCNFSDGISGRPLMEYPLEDLQEDLTYLKETFDLEHVNFNDDILAPRTERLRQLGALMKRLGLQYSCSMRLDMVDQERTRILEESGCKDVQVGIETASAIVAKNVDKRLDLARFQKNIEILQKSSLVVGFNFICGYIGENEKSLEDTYQFCLHNRILYTSFYATAYPGTKLWHMVREKFEIGDETEYLTRLSKADLQTDYVFNMSDLKEKKLRRTRDRMIIGTAIRCFSPSKIKGLMAWPFFALYWWVIKANNNRIVWLRRLTELINWAIIKPLLRKRRQST